MSSQYISPPRLISLILLIAGVPLLHWSPSVTAATNTFLSGGSDKKLYRQLTQNYDPDSRPIQHGGKAVEVHFLLIMKQIQDLDEKNQILMTNMLVKEEWKDENLRWDPSHYNNLTHFILPAHKVWLPDVYVYNNAADGDKGFIHVNESRILVRYDGQVAWTVPVTIHSSCSVDVLYFPFDHQFCELVFGSWTYDRQQLILRTIKTGVDTSILVENSELALRSIRAVTAVMRGPSGLYFPQVILKLHIQRKALFYGYTVIAPSILLCILTLFSFWLPCDNAEKIELGLTVFLFLYFLQLMVSENTPESNSTPLIGTFLVMVMTLNSISLVMATVVMHVKKRGDQDPVPVVPGWLWLLACRVLGPITCSKKPSDTEEDPEHEELELMEQSPEPCPDHPHAHVSGKDSDDGEPSPSAKRWFFVAAVVDKFLFEIYLLGTIIGIVIVLIILPESQSFDKSK